ncbi:MAG TPA: hydrogenase maturation nickel metallochaperone HypA [Roseiarcus sp.]|nr:hydrogenase maturation nickel metallochaperone HypA [Roseiarcus sp.]
MHELSLCQSIMELVVESAKRERMTRIARVVVEIGVAAAVDADALRFCFPIVAEDTLAAGAELAIVGVPLRARCNSCGAEFAPETPFDPCPACGGVERVILSGREMRVVSFEGA